jgi:hypothetical protein
MVPTNVALIADPPPKQVSKMDGAPIRKHPAPAGVVANPRWLAIAIAIRRGRAKPMNLIQMRKRLHSVITLSTHNFLQPVERSPGVRRAILEARKPDGHRHAAVAVFRFFAALAYR